MKKNFRVQPALFVILQVLLAAFSSQAVAGSNERPNVVIIFMDDMGYGDPVCYGGGPYQTPHMDALAAQGMRMTQFYAAQAVCTASRAALLTGCYPTRLSIHGAINHTTSFALNQDETTIAEMLRAAGYRTGMIGKWHLGHKEPYLPLQHGFEEFYGLPYSNDMWPYDYNGEPITDTSIWRSKYPPLPIIEGNNTVGIIKNFEDQDKLTTEYTTRAVSFIERHKDEPFFLYLAHSMVHVPLGASEKFSGKSGAGMFGDVMEEVDWSLGEVMQALEDNGIRENTIVIFTSDNGPWLVFGNHAGNTGGLREGKGTAFDGGVKVPCIISWPHQIQSGVVGNQLMTTMDILPTLASICKATLPALQIDGLDFSQVLTGETQVSPRKSFAYYYDQNNLKAIRDDRWKLVFPATSRTYGPPGTIGGDRYPGKSGSMQVPLSLFDLRTDPGEDRDVQDLHPDIVEKLTMMANEYRMALGDGLTNSVGTEVRPAGKVSNE